MKEDIVELKGKLSPQQMAILTSELTKVQKSVGLAYVLWFFLGTLGIHQYFIGKAGRGTLYLVGGLIGWIVLIVGIATTTGAAMAIGGILLGVIGILLLVDLFTIPRQVRRVYELHEIEIATRLLGDSAAT